MAAAIAAQPDQYREMDRLTCDCSPQRRKVAATYAGPGGQAWLWTAGGRGPSRMQVPPRAIPIPDNDDGTNATLATCPRCRRGWVLLPRPTLVDARRLTPPTYGRITSRR